MGSTTLSASNRYALGLGFLWSWGYIAHHSPAMLVDDATVGQLDVLFLCSLVTGVFCFALAAFFHRSFTESIIGKRPVLVAFAGFASAATAAMPLGLSLPIVSLLVGIISEIGTCVLFLAWGCAVFGLARGEIRDALVRTAVVIAAATIASQAVGGVVVYGATVAFPLLSVLLLPPDCAAKMRAARVRFVAPGTAFSSFRRFFLVIVSFGMAFGCFRLVLFSALGGSRFVSLMYFAGYGLGALALLLVMRLLRSRVDETAEFKAVLPLMVLALLMLTFSGPVQTVGAPVLLGAGSICFNTIEWTLMAVAVLRTRMSPVLCFSLTLGFSWMGTLAGSILGALSTSGLADPIVGPMIVVLCLVTAGMAMFGRLSVLSFEGSLAETEGGEGGDAQQPPSARAADSAAMSERFGLTQRESEILDYLLAGRSRSFIEEKLVLSKSTVKTHVRHIYEKVGVHSQQELLDLAESGKTPR